MNIPQFLADAARQGVFLSLQSGKELAFELSVATFEPTLKAKIIAHKAQIISYLQQLEQSGEKPPAISPRVDATAPCALSYAQQRLWFITQLDENSGQYNLPCAFDIKGAFAPDIAEKALNIIVNRHHILATTMAVAESDLEPQQQYNPQQKLTVTVHEISAEEKVQQFIAKHSIKPFDLANDLMLRVSIIKLAPAHWVLVFNTHHIASDGWSLALLFNEFCQLYRFIEANPHQDANQHLPALEIQYADYALWQRQQVEADSMADHIEYWQTQLADLPQLHALPLDFARPAQKQHAAGVVTTDIKAEAGLQLLELAKANDTTLFVVIHAALVILMGHHQNSEDIVIGTPVANRENPQLAPLIGFFANTLVLRSQFKAMGLSEHISNTKAVNQAANQYQDLPFESIVDALQVERSQAYSPLFQLLLAFDNSHSGMDEAAQSGIGGLTLTPRQGAVATTKFDLELVVTPANDQTVSFDWIYDKALFSETRIVAMADDFNRLLQAMTQLTTDTSIAQIDFCSPDYLADLARQQNNKVAVQWGTGRVCDRFEQMVAQQPNTNALHFEGLDVSYLALDQRANQLAWLLQSRYASSQSSKACVGICLERSIDMVVAILAVLKAGFAYVPIDPQLPQSRIDYIVKDCGALTVISVSKHSSLLSGASCLMLDEQTDLATQPKHTPEFELQPHSLAYLIYTSGSTGQPKGVMISHSALINRIDWMQNQYGLHPDDVVLQKTPFGFDVSVWEFIWTLSFGARLVVAKPEGHKDPEYLDELMTAQKVTVLHFVPSMLSAYLALVERPMSQSLRYLFCSGEALDNQTVSTLSSHSPHVECINLYGPTEAAIDVSHFTVGKQALAKGGVIPIGKAIQNTQLYVLGRQQQLLPAGVVGELYIGGDNLALGYINQPQLSAAAFVELALPAPLAPQRLYKTGDLVCLGQDGNIQYVGRNDSQIKIRGFRVELSEIEYQLCQLDDISEAKVLLHGGELHGFVLPAQSMLSDSWQTQLSAKLPAYMVPQFCHPVSAWPQSHNGKIDSKKLAAMIVETPVDDAQFREPQGELECLVAEVWAQVLEQSELLIGRDSRFFALGGNSLLIIRYKALLRQRGYQVVMAALYQNPTLAELAAQLQSNVSKLMAAPKTNVPQPWLPHSELTPQMFGLAELEQAELEKIIAQVPGGAGQISDIYPLSGLQQGLMFHSLQDPDADPYVLKTLFRLENSQWAQRFVDALNQMIVRHDALRTQVVYQDLAQPYQVVHRQAELPVSHFDIIEHFDTLDQIHDWLAAYQPSDESIIQGAAPLLRLHVLRLKYSEADCYFAALFNHHVIEDNFSSQVLQRDIARYLSGGVEALNQVTTAQYRSFIWQGLHTDLDVAERFFKQQLAGFNQVAMPFGFNERDMDITTMQTRHQTLGQQCADGLNTLAQRLNIGVAAIVHLAWAVVLGRISNQQDVVFGTVLSGRMQDISGIEHMVGLCINTLPLRFDLDDNGLEQSLLETQQRLVQTLAFEQVPLSQVLQYGELPGTSGLFNTILNCRLENQAPSKQDFDIGGIELMFGVEHTNYAMSASVDFVAAKQIEVTIESIAGIDAQIVAGYFANVLEQLAVGHCTSVNQLDVLKDQDIKHLMALATNPEQHKPASNIAFFDQLFERQVALTPDHDALYFDSQSYSYKQVNQRANVIAAQLIELGAGTGVSVGMFLPRSIDWLVAVIAIFKSGGVYVPLDPVLPAERLAFMAGDADIKIVVGRSDTEVTFVENQPLVTVDKLDYAAQTKIETVQRNAEDIAYIIYTSGSTGQPKGVEVSHGALAAQLQAEVELLTLDKNDRALLFTSVCFDAFAELAYGSLISGATLHIPNASLWPSDDFYQYVKQHQLTIADIPPAYLLTLMEQSDEADTVGQFWQQSPLQRVMVGGEALPEQVVNRWIELDLFASKRLINAYGPTEAVLAPCLHDVEPQGDFTSIGRPFAGRSGYVLDAQQRLLPLGVPGELYIGGDLLARGYRNQQALTAQRFIENPFASGRLYKTSDRVKWLSNGQIGFLGRDDNQIKIRGFRIEPGEIEHQLCRLEAVQSALVMAVDNGRGSNELVAYVVLDETQPAPNLTRQLAQTLPNYMLPSHFVTLEQWPLNQNGKIDRSRLPAPQIEQQQYIKPKGDCAQGLAQIWAGLLHLEAAQISADADFFELGGHSLLAVRLVAAIKQHFALAQFAPGIKDIFIFPVLQSMADEIGLMMAQQKNQAAKLALAQAESVEEGEI